MSCCFRACLVAQNLPAMQKTQVWSLGREDPLEKGMGTLSSILPWRIPWTGEPGGLQSMGSQRVRHDRATNTFIFSLVATFAENDSQFHVWLRRGHVPLPWHSHCLASIRHSVSISYSERVWSSGKDWIKVLVLSPCNWGTLERLFKIIGPLIWKWDNMGLLGCFKDHVGENS